jgi:hypothetical protein
MESEWRTRSTRGSRNQAELGLAAEGVQAPAANATEEANEARVVLGSAVDDPTVELPQPPSATASRTAAGAIRPGESPGPPALVVID